MTKGVKICLASVIVIFIAAVIASVIMSRPSDSSYVEIVRDGQTLYRLDLSAEKNRTFRIEHEGGDWNEITIEDGKICVSDADCPDHTCVKTGYLSSADIPIVCLPHRLIIRYCEE